MAGRFAGLFVALTMLIAACGGGNDPSADVDAVTTSPETQLTTTTTSATLTTTSTAAPTIAPGRVLCGQAIVAGVSEIECEGMTFHVALPGDCLEASCGVIIDVHPDGQTWETEEWGTSMRTMGTAAGYIVVHPESPQWNWDYRVDSGRIRSFLDQLVDALDVDRDRVHIGGASGGGYITWVFVCDHADLIASAAPLGAGTDPVVDESCDFDESGLPSEEVDILFVHGRSDTIVRFATAIDQLELVVAAWEMTESEVLVDEPTYRLTRWTNANGTILEFLEHDAGHCFPGVAYLPFGCSADDPVHYGEAALKFYLAHPKDE